MKTTQAAPATVLNSERITLILGDVGGQRGGADL
jgi:hypothetical protein